MQWLCQDIYLSLTMVTPVIGLGVNKQATSEVPRGSPIRFGQVVAIQKPFVSVSSK